jgi:arsenite methyltransferase
MNEIGQDEVRQAVRNRYKEIVLQSGSATCCSSTDVNDCSSAYDVSAKLGYSQDELNSVPQGANLGLGCGNPQAIAELKPGETVLDLGSGGGFDCFLASKQVGDTGFVIGVDMTPEMISQARKNASTGGFTNTEFRLGEIEYLPVANETVDVIISNCVINLSPDKPRVYQEAYRVLKPGGRIAVSDVIATAELPESVKGDLDAYSSCLSGASSLEEVEQMLKQSSFTDIRVESKGESKEFIKEWVPGSKLEDYMVSAIIKAVK